MSTNDATRATSEAMLVGDQPICERISELSRQLGEALAEWHDLQGVPHTFVAYVPSSKSLSASYYMLNQPWRAGSAEMRLTHHAKEFAKVAQEIDPTAEELLIGRAVAEMPGGHRFSAIVSAKQIGR